MISEPVQPPRCVDHVAVVDDRLVVHELTVDGAALMLAQRALEEGRDLQQTVREMLEVGGAVLLHGAGKATVDAVGAEVDRLLAVLAERSARIEAVRGVRERGTAKGFDFEDLLAPVLDAAFSPMADVLSVTAAQRGIAEDLAGDFCVQLNPRDTGGRDRRIVIEAKDMRLSMDKTLATLDAAMLNRDAQVGVIVFAKPDQAPLAGKPLRVVHGNRVVVVYDKDEQEALALDIGCHLARTLAITAERDDLTIDRAMLADRLGRLVNAIERAGAIQRGIRSARRGLDAAEDAYHEMHEQTLALVYELEDRLGD